MYVRLAFAVAAFLDPEILIVDEVLAVGDAEFQKKCLGKMNEVSKNEGRTVLFVSHNINAIKALCTQGVLLSKGQVSSLGAIDTVISKYLTINDTSSSWINENYRSRNKIFNPLKFYLIDEDFNELSAATANNKRIGLVIECELTYIKNDLVIGFALYNMYGELVYMSYQTDTAEQTWPKLTMGYNKLLCWLPTNFLNEGEYTVDLICGLYYKEWIVSPRNNGPTVSFEIQGGLSDSPNFTLARMGICAPVLQYLSLT